MSGRMTKTANRVSSFEDLDVFQRAYQVSLDVHTESLRFPKIEQFAMADQIRRASKSICENIAEGFSKQRASSAEYRRYLLMAIGSADEMRVWIRYCLDLKYIDDATSLRWQAEYTAIAKKLQVIYTRWSSHTTT